MILLLAVAAGLLAGLVRSRLGGSGHLRDPELRLVWLVPIAFLPQWLVFFWATTSHLTTDNLAAAVLVSTQLVLLVFAWFNRYQPGFWALGVGLALNLLVITLNGGLMPVSPETLAQLPNVSPGRWEIGDRIAWSTILPVSDTRLWWLSDQILMPAWFPARKALSLGDVLIAVGAFWLLWSLGKGETDESGANIAKEQRSLLR
jgi:hypothetical protein